MPSIDAIRDFFEYEPVVGWVRSQWEAHIESLGEWGALVMVLPAVYWFTYWALNIPLLLANFFPGWCFIDRWKIQKGRYVDWAEVKVMLIYAVVNQVMVAGVSIAGYERVKWVKYKAVDIPPVFDVVCQVLGVVLLYDFTFYAVHCLFHTKWLYYAFHQRHHLSKTTLGITSAYFHPIDLLASSLAVYAPLLLTTHLLPQLLFSVLLILETTNAHSGYSFPFSPIDARAHDFHHSHSTYASPRYRFVNMGAFFLLSDRLFGTIKPYHQYLQTTAKAD
eukprot:TRINITY_DN24231_c0_g1_i1.p1 TRINITY_DN24231_c0_g1~~TRINITY_DN24231_c0_g1_i1.p1  ORF type:complete len:309 (+),score=71.61 TRINITY_DN24231_c0_g1_i1:98-928(+)